MTGTVTSTAFNDDHTAVWVTVETSQLDSDGEFTHTALEFEIEPKPARRFPVGTVVALSIRPKRD